jgi:hypothetical protein
VTHSIIASANEGSVGSGSGVGYQKGEIFISQPASSGGSDIAVFSAITLHLKRVVPLSGSGNFGGLGADGITAHLNGSYQFNARAGDRLTLTTTTPAGDPQQPYEFHNTLVPVLSLYDSSGNLLATASGNAPDGKNAVLQFKVSAAGTYFAVVSGNNSSSGEYTLTIAGATGASAAFEVVTTSPPASPNSGPTESPLPLAGPIARLAALDYLYASGQQALSPASSSYGSLIAAARDHSLNEAQVIDTLVRTLPRPHGKSDNVAFLAGP